MMGGILENGKTVLHLCTRKVINKSWKTVEELAYIKQACYKVQYIVKL
jgi:hypothetical protein